jgi:hypothetical protein
MFSTPVGLIESYFGVELDRSGVRHLRGVPEGDWIDFAKQYRATMGRSFAKDFLEASTTASAPLPLYFEPLLVDKWDAAVRHLYGFNTPLLGIKPDPESEIDPDVASQMLQPLKKHLLVADSVYIRDNFYRCFDWLADYGSRTGWSDDFVQRQDVPFHVARLKAWLPLLMELRPLIESRALVFMPWWLTPSFPYANYTIEKMNALKLGIGPSALDFRASPEVDFVDWDSPPESTAIAPYSSSWDPSSSPGGVDVNAVITAWLNARLMGLNPVFPGRAMYDFGSLLYFRGDEDRDRSFELTSDLMSFDILPLGRKKPVGVKELVSLRKNEEGFAAVRSAVMTCQQRLKDGLTSQATQKDAQVLCRDVMDDYKAEYGGKAGRVVNLLNQNVVAGTVLSLAVSAAMIPTAGISAAIGVLAPALLSPAIANIAVNRRNSASRALTQLQAIL